MSSMFLNFLLLLSILIVVVSGSKFDMADEINALDTTWRAEVSTRFYTATAADLKVMLGTVMKGDTGYIPPEEEKSNFLTATADIPESFDGRTKWPQCADVIGHIRDQSSCGSCWAFGSTEAFNDRHCIATGDSKVLFSPEDTVSCCSGLNCHFSMGCNGGQPSGAWGWFTKVGVSSGGDFEREDSGDSCKPYSFQSCAHHVAPPPGIVACDTLPEFRTPTCTNKCDDPTYAVKYKTDKHKARSVYAVIGEKNMQKEIMEKGTITVAFTVFEDFELYKSGVYQHVKGLPLGGHAVKMIGWGVEDTVPYWICVNSWNNLWGEGGTFRILRGKNECEIESESVAGEV